MIEAPAPIDISYIEPRYDRACGPNLMSTPRKELNGVNFMVAMSGLEETWG